MQGIHGPQAAVVTQTIRPQSGPLLMTLWARLFDDFRHLEALTAQLPRRADQAPTQDPYVQVAAGHMLHLAELRGQLQREAGSASAPGGNDAHTVNASSPPSFQPGKSTNLNLLARADVFFA